MINHFNPEDWLLTCNRCIKEWAESFLNPAVHEVVMEFPGPLLDDKELPFTKALVHFAIDSIDSGPLGMGENVFADNYDIVLGTVNPQYGEVHAINYDVGIWTSDRSGGTTMRASLRQTLQLAFGISNVAPFRDASNSGDGGVEIRAFTGGRFVSDRINDLPVYRTVNGELEVRVFSRTPLSDTPGPAIEEIVQAPGLTIIG